MKAEPVIAPFQYEGPESETQFYDWDLDVPATSLGVLARGSDAIGIGTVVSHNWQYMNIHVDQAFAGCTNNQTIVIEKLRDIRLLEHPDFFEYEHLFPTNSGKIVFSAMVLDKEGYRYNNYFMADLFYPYPDNYLAAPTNGSVYGFAYDKRQWWYADRDDGVLLTQLTNIMQHVRIEPNMTNFYHLVRDGLSSTSSRVREDSHNDLWNFIDFSYPRPDRREFIENDPLLPPEFKAILYRPRPNQ